MDSPARSISPIYAGEPLNAAFASNLDALVADTSAVLWVHGHTHSAADYAIGRTRVLGNPRGYPSESGTAFKPDLVVEI